eukprot:COSAG02_NODE_134_length_34593_cov_43.594886_1_plen_70_part_10
MLSVLVIVISGSLCCLFFFDSQDSRAVFLFPKVPNQLPATKERSSKTLDQRMGSVWCGEPRLARAFRDLS